MPSLNKSYDDIFVDFDKCYPSDDPSYSFDLDSSLVGCNFKGIYSRSCLMEKFVDNIRYFVENLKIPEALLGRADEKADIVV